MTGSGRTTLPTSSAASRRALRCGNCMKHYKSEFFAKDRSSPDGYQSWCRLCKAEWERGPEGVWKRLRVWLEKYEPVALKPPHGWTEELYISRWHEAKGLCEWCGAGLGEWQIAGHRLDRIDNDTPHIPANCRMLCWVCNRRKSNKHWHIAEKETKQHVNDHGMGRVPWQTIEPWAKRVFLPDPTPYIVEVQTTLFGDTGT